MYDPKLVVAQIFAIQNRYDLSNEALGSILGVTGAYIGQVKKGEKNLSAKRVRMMCHEYGIDHTELLADNDTKEIEIHESIADMMRIKGVDIYQMEELTGIPALRVSQIQRGKVEPTSDEVRKISNAVGTKPELLSQGAVLRNLEVIRRALEGLNLSQDVIAIHMEAIEREL